MKLPAMQILKSILGEDIVAPHAEGQPGVPMTFAMVVQNALLGAARGDENMDGATKLEMYRIATKTLNADADYSVEEVAKIKDRIGRMFGPVVVGPAWGMIEDAGKAEAS